MAKLLIVVLVNLVLSVVAVSYVWGQQSRRAPLASHP